MKVTATGSTPPTIQAQTTNTNDAARNRAINMLANPQANEITEHPVPNANKVSPEDLSAIQPPTKTPLEVFETTQEAPKDTANIGEEKPEATDPDLEKRFQQIARQERALRAKAQQQHKDFKAREAALAAKEQELTAKSQQPDMSQYIHKSRLQEDALGVLEAEGISTYDDITQRAMTRQPVDPMIRSTMERLQAKIDKLEADAQSNQKAQIQQQQDTYKAAVKQITTDARQLVNNDPEFETVKAMNATRDVVELIEQTYAKDGVVLTVEEAAKEVENYLVEEALKITQIDKIKRRMAAANASQLKSEVKPQSQQQTQMKTLTNATSSTRPLTARERAIAAAEGRLKS